MPTLMTLLAPCEFERADRVHSVADRLALRDPRSASLLPPFARARRFLEHVGGLSAAEWDDVLRRADADADARGRAVRHLRAMFVTPARRTARDALLRVAEHAVFGATDQGRIDDDVADNASSLASDAALALVLRDLLPFEHFDALFHPFSTDASRGPGHGTAGPAARVAWIPLRRASVQEPSEGEVKSHASEPNVTAMELPIGGRAIVELGEDAPTPPRKPGFARPADLEPGAHIHSRAPGRIVHRLDVDAGHDASKGDGTELRKRACRSSTPPCTRLPGRSTGSRRKKYSPPA